MNERNRIGRRTWLRNMASAAALAVAMPVLSGAPVLAASDEPLKVTYFYNFSAVDGGWNEAFLRSQDYLKEKFGDRVEVEYKENVPEGPQVRRIVESAIQNGTDVVVSTTYGYGETMLKMAEAHKDVHFIVSQWDNPGNLDNFVGFVNAPEDGAYVAGVAAGHIVEPGAQIGWVDAFPIPYDIRTINGFALGVAHSNPTATIQVVFTNDWSDRNLQARATRSLIDAGSTMIGTSIGGPAIAEAAESAGIPVVTSSLDVRDYAPNHLVTTYEYVWGPAIEIVLNSIFEDSFSTDFLYANMSMGAVDVSPWGGAYNALSDDAKADIQAEYDRIRGGAAVFTGPLSDKAGNQVLAEGEVMPLAKLRGMDFVVSNVNGVEF